MQTNVYAIILGLLLALVLFRLGWGLSWRWSIVCLLVVSVFAALCVTGVWCLTNPLRL